MDTIFHIRVYRSIRISNTIKYEERDKSAQAEKIIRTSLENL